MRIGARGQNPFVPEFAGRMPRTPMNVNFRLAGADGTALVKNLAPSPNLTLIQRLV